MAGARPAAVWPGAATRIAGLIGSDIRRSLSPAIHNAAFAATGLDWAYAAFVVPPGGGGNAVGAVRSLGLAGLSVTMPHKAAAAAAVDRLGDAAAATGAVNTVVWDGPDLVGENTDAAGFTAGLAESLGMELGGHRILLLGAGGAARAVAYAAAKGGAAGLVVAARREEAASEIASIASALGLEAEVCGLELQDLAATARSAGLLVNSTPIGADGRSSPMPTECLRADLPVYDLIYTPDPTPLVAAARETGAAAAAGLEMLVAQAAEQFALWTGREAPVEVMRRAAREARAATP